MAVYNIFCTNALIYVSWKSKQLLIFAQFSLTYLFHGKHYKHGGVTFTQNVDYWLNLIKGTSLIHRILMFVLAASDIVVPQVYSKPLKPLPLIRKYQTLKHGPCGTPNWGPYHWWFFWYMSKCYGNEMVYDSGFDHQITITIVLILHLQNLPAST